MSCWANGRLITEEPYYLNVRESTIAGMAQTINIAHSITFESVMEMLTVHWGAVPGIAGELVLTRESVAGVRYNTVLRKIDPSGLGADDATTDWVCVCPFRFTAGDVVAITYANPSDLDVGVEFKYKQV